MNKKVLVTISGIQDNQEDSIQTIQQGNYRLVAGKHVISYQEVAASDDGTPEGVISNLLRISKDSVSLTKRGATSAELFFQKGAQHTSVYETQFGSLQMSLFTSKLSIQEEEDRIEIEIEYGLELNYRHISDCNIKIQIRSLL